MTKFVDVYAARLLEALEKAEAPADWAAITEAAQALAGWVPPELHGRLPRGDEPLPPPANGSPPPLDAPPGQPAPLEGPPPGPAPPAT
jgi:hypothetical protein